MSFEVRSVAFIGSTFLSTSSLPAVPQEIVVRQSSAGTALPRGVQPASLSQGTGADLGVGEVVYRSSVERLAAGSLGYLRQIARVLPVDEGDEQVMERLSNARAARLRSRPFPRKDGT